MLSASGQPFKYDEKTGMVVGSASAWKDYVAVCYFFSVIFSGDLMLFIFLAA